MIVGILNSYEHFTIPALTPVAWNLAIIVGLVLGVPRADTVDTKLYVYAVSILVGTVIQVLLPVPWLRGLDGRLRVALDWRDPAVKQVFVLMMPVTLGLGLINFNTVVDTLFASRLDRPRAGAARDRTGVPHLHAPAGDLLGRRRDRALPDAVAAGRPRGHGGLPHDVGSGLRLIGFLLIPASAAIAALADADRAARLPARRVHVRTRRWSSRSASPRSRSASPSTARS